MKSEYEGNKLIKIRRRWENIKERKDNRKMISKGIKGKQENKKGNKRKMKIGEGMEEERKKTKKKSIS
jgi:hypothetical protein